MRMLRPLFLGLLAWASLAPAQTPAPDPWAPVRFLAGQWQGASTGQSGEGKAVRRYEFILKGRFLHERNTSTYPPQEKNKPGEVHEHQGFLTYDKARRLLVLRQFHQEGFVNQYALSPASTATRLVFESEHFENFSNKWKARESYDLVGPDEFIETFELAPPDKPFEVYSRNHFKRTGR